MRTLQNAFLNVLKSLPHKLLSRMVEEKLQTAGVPADKKLLNAVVEHILSKGDAPFEWDHELPDVVIRFDQADAAKLKADVAKFREKAPNIVNDLARSMTKKMLVDYKRNWSEYQDYELSLIEVFRINLEGRWGKALDGLRILADYCREVGARYNKSLKRSKSQRNLHLRIVLSGLHLRACQVTTEIIVLLENGFADGAMARWRTLYELFIVASVIQDGGEVVAQRYHDHDHVEAKKAMDEYIRNHEALGFSPAAKSDVKAITVNYEATLLKYGKDFKNEYGWASELLNRASPRFSDLEAKANLSAMRSYYKLASYNVHAGVRGLTQRIGTIDDPAQLIGGATNAGLEEPGIRTAMSLAGLTILLMGRATIDGVVEMHALGDLRDEACTAFARAARRLRKDEMAIRRSRAAERKAD